MKKRFKLKLDLRNNFLVIYLLRIDKDEIVDIEEIEDKNNLSCQLLVGVDKLLNRNGIYIEEISAIRLEEENAGYTSSRITHSVIEAANYCLTFFV